MTKIKEQLNKDDEKIESDSLDKTLEALHQSPEFSKKIIEKILENSEVREQMIGLIVRKLFLN